MHDTCIANRFRYSFKLSHWPDLAMRAFTIAIKCYPSRFRSLSPAIDRVTHHRDSCRSNDSSSYGSYCSGSRAHMRQKQPTKRQPEGWQPEEQLQEQH